MKTTNLFYLLLLGVLISCSTKEEEKNYVTFSGKIENPFGDKVFVSNLDRTYQKEIMLKEDGSFSDTFNLTGMEGNMIFSDGREMTPLFLKNGDDLRLTLNTEEFDETVSYSGKGADNNNYYAKKMLLVEQLIDAEEMIDLDSSKFENRLSEVIEKLNAHISESKNLDSMLVKSEEAELEKFKLQLQSQYNYYRQLDLEFAGKPAPNFENYTTIDGKTFSLNNLKGKYAYLDIWATWCAPCKKEIPFLKELEKQYHDKNIAFVSISVDATKDKDKWEAMVAEKELGGIQVFADSSWNSSFMKTLKVNSIPRFILLDPNGVIVDPNAPRPSQKEKVNELLQVI